MQALQENIPADKWRGFQFRDPTAKYFHLDWLPVPFSPRIRSGHIFRCHVEYEHDPKKQGMLPARAFLSPYMLKMVHELLDSFETTSHGSHWSLPSRV